VRPFLASRLKRILWVFRSTADFAPYREKKLFYHQRRPSGRRRFQLVSWNGSWNGKVEYRYVKVEYRYVKFWDCTDYHKGKLTVNLDHTIVRREHPREKKMPGYKTHDSAAAVMAYLGCSRATAFRRIKEGFRIPAGLDNVLRGASVAVLSGTSD
jgi:hypothetical protein